MSKPLADDAEVYVKKAKERASPVGQTMEKLDSIKDQEISDTMKKIDLIRARKALAEVESGTGMSTNAVIGKLFENKSTEEINEMLSNMTPEAVDNLVKLAKSLDNNPVTAIMRQGGGAEKPQSGNDLLLQYLLKKADEKPAQPAQQGITMSDVVAIVKLVNESKSPPPVQQGGGMSSALETVKLVSEMNRPFYETLSKKDKELMDLKLAEIKNSQPPDIVEQIKYVKDMTGALGLGNARSEIDLKLEEMRENREIDLKRLDWEQKKYEMEIEADATKWEQIGRILQGPVGDVIKNVGSAGADRVRGTKPANPSRVPKTVQTQCPNCGEVIYVDAEADTAVCGKCGATLQKAGGGSPPPAPAPTRVDAPPPAPSPAPAAVAVASAEDGEGNEESEDNGYSEDSNQTEQQ